MQVTDAMVAKAAESDAAFDGRTWLAMPKSERERYMERSRRSLTAALAEMWRRVNTKTYREGFGARLAGRQIHENPYATFTVAHSNWQSGWVDQNHHLTGRDVALESIGWFGRPSHGAADE